MRRSLSKLQYATSILDLFLDAKKILWTKNRKLKISPNLVGKKIMVYNGMNYYPIEIKDSIIGESLGKFSVSRKNNTKKAKGKNKR